MKHLIREALRYGWHTLRTHSKVLLPGAVLLTAVGLAGSFLSEVGRFDAPTAFGVVVQLLLSVILAAGYFRLCLGIANGEPVSLRDTVPPGKVALRYAWVGLVQTAVILGGLVLLILPGLYFLVRLSFAGFASIEGAWSKEAINTSFRLTRNIFWPIAGFLIVIFFLEWLGAALYIGSLITIPLTSLAWAHVYVKLKTRA